MQRLLATEPTDLSAPRRRNLIRSPRSFNCTSRLSTEYESLTESTRLVEKAWFLFTEQVNLRKSENCFRSALSIRERILGADHLSTAMAMRDLAVLLHASGALVESYNYYERSLKVIQRQLGRDHLETAICFNELGSLLQTRGEFSRARVCYSRSLRILRRARGSRRQATANCLNDMGRLFMILQN